MNAAKPRRYQSMRSGWVAIALIVTATHAAPAFAQAPAAGDWNVPERKLRQRNPLAATEANVAAGKKLYVHQCGPCHGWLGNNDGPYAPKEMAKARRHTDPLLWNDSDGALFWKISEGRAPMPSTRGVLSDQERWQIVTFMRTLAPKPKAAAPGSR